VCRVEEYRTQLGVLDTARWPQFLTRHSGLPGTRGNIELGGGSLRRRMPPPSTRSSPPATSTWCSAASSSATPTSGSWVAWVVREKRKARLARLLW